MSNLKQLSARVIAQEGFDSFLANIPSFGLIALLSVIPSILTLIVDKEIAANPFFFIFIALYGLAIQPGVLYLSIRTSEGSAWSITNVFVGLKTTFLYFVCSMLIGLLSIVSLLLLLVGGLVMVRFQFALWLLVDYDLGPIEALKESWRITEGRFWLLSRYAFILILIVVAFAAVLAILGFVLGVNFSGGSSAPLPLGFALVSSLSAIFFTGLVMSMHARAYLNMIDSSEGSAGDDGGTKTLSPNNNPSSPLSRV